MSLDVDPSAAGWPGFDVSDLDAFELLSGAARDEVFMDTERQIRQLHALQALRLHRVERSRSHFDDGHRTVKIWHRRVTNGSPSTSRLQVLLAEMLAALPVIAAAAVAGDLGADQLRLLSHLYANPRARDLLPGYWENELVGHARTRVLSDFERICRRWERNADPDGARQKHEIARANRCAKRSVVGAGSQITINGDALSGEVCWKVIQAHAEAEYLTDVERRAARYGDDAPNYPLPRSHGQRMHDAFVAVCIKARDATHTTTPEPATPETATAEPATAETETAETATAETPDVSVTADTATGDTSVSGPARVEAGVTEPLVVLHTTPEFAIAALLEYFGFDPAKYLAISERMTTSQRLHFCQTAGGAHIDARTLAVALLCGQIQRLATDPKGHTINLGRKSRLFTGAPRDAVLLNDDRCSNCGTRHPGIQIDHLLSWEHLGHTDQDNAGPNCPWCNRDKHRLNIAVTRDETGWHYYRPDGTEIAPRHRPTAHPPDTLNPWI